MIVTITNIYTDIKEGKYGPSQQISLKIAESTAEDINGDKVSTAGKYIRGFFKPDFVFPYKQGEQGDILIVQKGEYLNFTLPGVGKAPAPDANALINRIKKIEERLDKLDGGVVTVDEGVDIPAEAVDPDDF